MFKKVLDFIKNGVWQKDEQDFTGKRTWWAVKQFRIILFTAKGFNRHDTAVRSAALSFYTVMSLVPILALIFAIFKGFGMEESFNGYLYDLFPNYTNVVDQIVVFINNLLERTKGGIIAVSAFFLLIWAVIRVFGNVESAFNTIWEVKRSRSFARRFTGYMAIIILVPILWLTASSLSIAIRSRVELITGGLLAEILFGLASVAVVVMMFSLLYYIIPNTTVKYRHALKAAAFAGTAFWIFQVGYVLIQGNLGAYNAIYGTFAAIPLFLLWLQISWQILLFGGELSFAMQNIRDFEVERQAREVSYDSRCKIMIAVMTVVIRNYIKGNTLSTPDDIAGELGIPIRMVRDISYELENDGMLLYVHDEKTDRTDSMAPAKDPHSIRFFDIINSVTGHGSSMPGMKETPLMKRIETTYEKVKGDIRESGDNILLIELI